MAIGQPNQVRLWNADPPVKRPDNPSNKAENLS